MFLKSLSIFDKDENIFRYIEFKKGLNLILSNTNSIIQTSSHNNVGKTTLLRVIDFCLGSKTDKEIYTDSEFNREDKELYQQIKEFSFELELANGLKIRRSIQNRTKIYIDEVEYSVSLSKSSPWFSDKLKELFFNLNIEKPTFRQIIQKFIRNDSKSMENTIKAFKHTNNADYELIYLTLFGFSDILDSLNRKTELLKELKTVDNGLKYFKSTPKKALEAEIPIDRKNIEELEKQIKNYQFDEFFNIYEKDLNKLIKDIRDSKQKIALLNFKLDNSQKSFESIQYSIDSKAVEYIYKEVNRFNQDMQKKFEEVSEFHNQVIKDRSNYYQEQITKLRQEVLEEQEKLNSFRKIEKKYFKNIDGNPSLEDYNSMMNQKSQMLQDLQEKESNIKQMEELEKNKKQLSEKLKLLEEDIENKSAKYQEHINIFNQYFTEITKKLYNTEWYLYEDFDKNGNRTFKIDKIGLSGTGEKKAEIVAFDLAYISFINHIGLDFPKFVTHDGIDQISEYQKETIFDIANEVNGQYILAINIDQLPQSLREDRNFIKQNTILELSKSDKFFRL
jgi:uncharacterized protein YydD (DUF2326 family)